MMKKTLFYLIVYIMVSILAVSCETEETFFDEPY